MANPLLALSVQQPDIAGSFSTGMEQAGAQRTARLSSLIQQYQLNKAQDADAQQNKLQQLYQSMGADIAAGDPHALGQLAKIDPNAAIDTQNKLATGQKTQADVAKSQFDTALSHIQFVGQQADSILAAPPEMRPILYSRAKAQAKAMGIDVSQEPQDYSDEGIKALSDQAKTAAQRLQEHTQAQTAKNEDATRTETERNNRFNNKVAQENADTAAEKAKTIDPLTAMQDPIVQSHVTNILNGNETMQQVPTALRNAVSVTMANAPKEAYSPLAASRLTMAAQRMNANYIKLPQFQLTANGLPYLQRIDAAMKTPGSVSDQDLLDSLTKLNTAGNAITDAQVKLITDGKSYADMVGTFTNKFKNGGVLSDNQRQQIQKIAGAVYDNYKKGYQPVYDKAAAQLKAAGIPEAFWGLPDLNKLSDQATAADVAPKPTATPSVKTKAEFDALPSGTIYTEQDGKQYRKP